jgi:DtxR family Mn-dependent transcriptional regulator
MADHRILPIDLSESEEMYLATIARLQEGGALEPVPLTRLAGELSVLPVSANQMVRKLEENGLVSYAPYKGVSLSDAGQIVALRILRHRRLWEVFLVEHLQYQPDEAQSLACRLEHTLPAEAAERLAAFLGHPFVNPSGQAIPAAQNSIELSTGIPLSQFPLNRFAQVTSIAVDAVARAFLETHGLRSGVGLTILSSADNADLLVELAGERRMTLSASLAQAIFVFQGCADH